MPEKLLIPVMLPSWLHRSVLRAKRMVIPGRPRPIDITGERNVEWAFLSKEMGNGPGNALEFGCENGYMSLLAAQKGFDVLAVDLEQQSFCWQHPGVKFQQGDFLTMELPSDYFDVVINCSSVEHVGVPGRYGITVREDDGDIKVMRRFGDILKHDGVVLMTAPCGQDAVLAPWCRVYGQQRLPQLFAPFQVLNECYWMKNEDNQWTKVSRETALSFKPHNDPSSPFGCSYALGCFVLRKNGTTSVSGGLKKTA
jgi:SAM-dependent methyltransferase